MADFKRTELIEAKAKALADYKEHIAMLDEKVKKFMAEIEADRHQAHRVYCTVIDNLEKKYAT